MHSTEATGGSVPGEARGGAASAPRRAAVLLALVAAAAVVAAPAPLPAQWAFRARLDNDAYTFWQHPARRTDEEYSNGVRISAEGYHAPWWARRWRTPGQSCDVRAESRSTCVSHELLIGQDIYTPNLERAPYMVPDWEQERPYAAWLFVSSSARFARPRTLDEVELALGVTGEPALGRVAQSVAHWINQRYTRKANGWETQVAFEPGVLTRYRRTWLARAAERQGAGIEVQPFVGAALGNILTQAEAGFNARLGFALSHPWHVPSWHARPPFEVFVLGGVRQQLVLHNFSLDGNLVQPNRSVARVPAVGEYTLGFGARMGRVSVAWRAVTRGREYDTGPRHHSVGIMQGSVEVVP